MNYRLYTFVANNYLSPLQCGIQTAHVVGEIASAYMYSSSGVMNDWLNEDKTIIVCGAGNHAGVVDGFNKIKPLADIHDLPCAIFREDGDSMNGMATAFGIILPEKFYNAEYVKMEARMRDFPYDYYRYWYPAGASGPEGEFATYPIYDQFPGVLIHLIKSYKLA